MESVTGNGYQVLFASWLAGARLLAAFDLRSTEQAKVLFSFL